MRELTVTDAADQQFTVILEGRRCTIRLRFNVSVGRWMFGLAVDEAPVVSGRRMVLNRDVLAPYRLGLGAIFLAGEGDPGRDELPGGTVRLYIASEAEIAAAKAV